MALPNTTTLSAKIADKNQQFVLLASLTNVFTGRLMRIDDEMLRIIGAVPSAATVPVQVLRGQEGTAAVAHAVTAQVLLGERADSVLNGGVSDWGQPTAGAAQPISGIRPRARRIINYTVAGAITLPSPGEDMVAIIDGTGALAMTLAAPSVLQDGDMLTVIGNGAAAHTVLTPAPGFGGGGAGYVRFTFAAGGQNEVQLVAANGIWVTSLIGGTATNITATISA